MKKLSTFLLIGVAMLGTSCKKFLDVNNNPNQAISATPQLLLPQALTATAIDLNGFNTYGALLGGYGANAGGIGGFGSTVTYAFSSSDYQGLWNNTYNNLQDYKTILDQTDGKVEYSYFNAVARIMKAHGFQLLVDTYNDVPYFDALKGPNNLTPKYTDAKVIYKDLADELDKAIATIDAGNAASVVTPLGNTDVMFGGDMTKWKQFANTLKLRLIIHASGKVTFSNTTFTADGFLTDDAQINPGFARDNGKVNPKWFSWAYSATGSDAPHDYMPTTFAMSFYNGTKLNDPGRGKALYYQFPATPTNRLGYEDNSVAKSPSGSFWYPGSDRDGKIAGNATGALKGPDASMPVITAAESYFLQAEAAVRGIITDDAKTLFNNGILASFTYLYTLPDQTLSGDPSSDFADYLANNNNYLVNFDLATTLDQKIEAIITQKYIALNMVNSDQAWNDYRRTHYPSIINNAGATGTQTFASSQSQATSIDKLPTRILYPTSEGSYNSANVPKGINQSTSKIFWAL